MRLQNVMDKDTLQLLSELFEELKNASTHNPPQYALAMRMMEIIDKRLAQLSN